jgi:hypothetical protein
MLAAILTFLAIGGLLFTSGPQVISGVYALQTGSAKTIASMEARAVAGAPLERKLDFSLGDDTKTIRRYDLDMTKYAHLIIVSDDFRTFLHVHPALHKNGHFTIAERFPKPALYHLYADCEPAGFGQQVFRYDLDLGASAGEESLARDLAPTGNVVTAGPYRVMLDTTTMRAAGETRLRVRITKNGKPARDLHPYLGALAHAVFIDGADLTYVHVHPVAAGDAMRAMRMPALADRDVSAPEMDLHVAVREPGVYKLWLQFRGSGGLHVAAFVLNAR